MQRYTWVPPAQGYKVVSVVSDSEERAKSTIAFHVRERIRAWNIAACEYYGMNDTNEFPFDRHELVVSGANEVYEHQHS
jgi:hypothetical protein